MSPRSLPSSLDGAWIEIFRAGDYGARGRWTEQHLDQLAAAYDPRRHAAPVVLGHPADDAPAYGWVRRIRRAGQSLWAQLEKVDPALETLLRAGRFAQRSVALYTNFPATGGPYLRHLGFLGAAPPAVKGLAPVRFADAASVAFAFDDQLSEVAMPESKSKLEAFFDHLRAFFTPGEPNKDVIPSEAASHSAGRGEVEGPAFAERLAALEQRLEALAPASQAAPEKTTAVVTPQNAELPAADPGPRTLSRAQARDARVETAAFVESLRSRGRFPPAFDRWGVPDFMNRLAALDTSFAGAADTPLCPPPSEEENVILSEAKDREQESPHTFLLAWFQDFLTKLPAVIQFGELGAHESRVTNHQSRPVVRFTEPRRGMSIDPASVELAERAEALAAELGVSYAEALARLREEARRTPTTA